MKRVGTDADVEKHDESRIEQRRAPVPQPAKTPRRGPKRRIKEDDTPRAAEAAGKFDILHQWNIREAAQRSENADLDKDRLVAKKRPCRRADATHQLLPSFHPAMAVIKPSMKRSAVNSFVPCRGCQGIEMFGTQLGIRMMKAQKAASCDRGASIHLRAARWSLADYKTNDAPVFQISQRFGRFDRGDDPLYRLRMKWNAIHQSGDKVVIAPDWND